MHHSLCFPWPMFVCWQHIWIYRSWWSPFFSSDKSHSPNMTFVCLLERSFFFFNTSKSPLFVRILLLASSRLLGIVICGGCWVVMLVMWECKHSWEPIVRTRDIAVLRWYTLQFWNSIIFSCFCSFVWASELRSSTFLHSSLSWLCLLLLLGVVVSRVAGSIRSRWPVVGSWEGVGRGHHSLDHRVVSFSFSSVGRTCTISVSVHNKSWNVRTVTTIRFSIFQVFSTPAWSL